MSLLSKILDKRRILYKAAILEKVPTEQFGGKAGHDLEELGKRYANLYPGKKFLFEIPFRTEEMDLVNPHPIVVDELKRFIAEHANLKCIFILCPIR